MWSKQDNTNLTPNETWNQSNYFIAYSIVIFVSLLLDDAEITKEIRQKTVESPNSDQLFHTILNCHFCKPTFRRC